MSLQGGKKVKAWRQWGDHPLVVILASLAAIASIISFIPSMFQSRKNPGDVGKSRVYDPPPVPAQAERSARVAVRDRRTRQPIGQAKITFLSKDFAPTGYTDSEGIYILLPSIPSRAIGQEGRLVVNKEGYETYERHIRIGELLEEIFLTPTSSRETREPQPPVSSSPPTEKTPSSSAGKTEESDSQQIIFPKPKAENTKSDIEIKVEQLCGQNFTRFTEEELKPKIEEELRRGSSKVTGVKVAINGAAGYRVEDYSQDPGTTIRAYAEFVVCDQERKGEGCKIPRPDCAGLGVFSYSDVREKNRQEALTHIAACLADKIKEGKKGEVQCGG